MTDSKRRGGKPASKKGSSDSGAIKSGRAKPVRVVGSRLSHIGASGEASMVDVGEKPSTRRRAVAQAIVRVGSAAARAIRSSTVAKGNVFEVARIAGISAAKRTDELIPLCHSLPVDHLAVDLDLKRSEVHIRAEASAYARTGVEMEAMTAASVAALTVYDMLKAVDKGIEIVGISLVEKSGGKSGTYRRKGAR